MKLYKVIVSDRAKQSLKNILAYIKEDSPSASQHVKQALLSIISSLKTTPKKFALDPILADVSNEYHSVTKWHYKIIYKVTDKHVIVINITHTSMHPDTLKKRLK